MSIENNDDQNTTVFDRLFNKAKNLLDNFWKNNPDLYKIIQRKKELKVKREEAELENDQTPQQPYPAACQQQGDEPLILTDRTMSALQRLIEVKQSPMLQWKYRDELKSKIRTNHRKIRNNIVENNGQINHRTAAHNRKCTFESVKKEQQYRAELLEDQIKVWRRVLPSIVRKFAKIPDPRNPLLIRHKKTMLLMYGLFAFVFKLSSTREMNRKLSGALVLEHLKKICPDIDSIPHACTLSRFLEKINPHEIEAANIAMIRDMMRDKKFKKLLIQGHVPISIDGAQKLYRDGVLQDPRWCERLVGSKDNQYKQQYIYVVEANLTFKNGLNIPLMSKFLFRKNNQLEDVVEKQDSGTPRGVYISEVKVLTRKRCLPHLGSSFELMEVTT